MCLLLAPSQSLTGAFLLAVAALGCLAPAKVAEKPPHSGLQALFKRVAGLPPQLDADMRGVD